MMNRQFPSFLLPLFQSESKCERLIWKISYIYMQSLVHLHVNKTDFHVKAFALGLALKQRRKATQKSSIDVTKIAVGFYQIIKTTYLQYIQTMLLSALNN